MPVFDPQHNAQAFAARLADAPDTVVIACYCAAWCRSCTDYQPDFEALADKWPQYTFAWIDIEENPEFLDDEDVDNFPTLLIQDHRGNVFFGALLPYISHLEQLLARYNPEGPRIAGGPGPLAGLAHG
ncbi:thioredoxin [Allopusillimonas soli]|uniref:Thioredoxin family protein n=1 Tax=Allopusillimonas soli TaxID=659016 RepID=A0A853FDS5_9BURK|nr:thioredoxin family protein [Allopusillimonas soli]NYT39015.1 thioredoxin family protein [Allopusillimonas soli]TEA69545.1 thioredoxin [Allopusillimonas soli]